MSDQEIQTTVTEELRYTPSVDTHVGVAVNDGTVTLSGEVGSLAERIAAKRAVIRVSGVRAVANKLQVRVLRTPGTNDADIAQTAGQRLERAIDVPSESVRAKVHDHVITLSGRVTWDYQRDAAVRAVLYIRGVTGVANTITLCQGESVSVMADTARSGSQIAR